MDFKDIVSQALLYKPNNDNSGDGYSPNKRIIIDQEIEGGFFVMPQNLDAEDEVKYAKIRMDAIRIDQYSDSKCGLPNTYDETGAYICGGCNKHENMECLIRKYKLTDLEHQSCKFWEVMNAGDPEKRYCPEEKMDDDSIGFGSTKNDEGFGCMRCEYGQQMLNSPDSEGRSRWCKLKGMPVMDRACCGRNEPEDD